MAGMSRVRLRALPCLVLLCLVAAATAAPIDAAWAAYQSKTANPPPKTVPSVVSGLDGACVCAVFAYSSPACQAAVQKHCKTGTGAPGGQEFCRSMLGGLRGLASSQSSAALVALYLQQLCFPVSSLKEDPEHCPCFKDPYSRGCVLARLGLCGPSLSVNICPALTLGPAVASPKQISSMLATSDDMCFSSSSNGAVSDRLTVAQRVRSAAKAAVANATQTNTTAAAAPVGPAAASGLLLRSKNQPLLLPPPLIGVIVGASVGGLLLLLAVLCWCCIWHKRTQEAGRATFSLPQRFSDSSVHVPCSEDGGEFIECGDIINRKGRKHGNSHATFSPKQSHVALAELHKAQNPAGSHSAAAAPMVSLPVHAGDGTPESSIGHSPQITGEAPVAVTFYPMILLGQESDDEAAGRSDGGSQSGGDGSGGSGSDSGSAPGGEARRGGARGSCGVDGDGAGGTRQARSGGLQGSCGPVLGLDGSLL